MRILVSAANLHAGGGVAVASSVIDEFSRMDSAADMTVLASSEVDSNLRALGTNLESFDRYCRLDLKGASALWARLPVKRKDFDAVLVIFGPSYSIPLAANSTVGFAQPWIAFPQNPAAESLPRSKRMKVRLKFFLMSLAFLPARKIVVEQSAVRDGLRTSSPLRHKEIDIVSSVVDSIYSTPVRWEPVDLPAKSADFRFGVISRNYPHKNLAILPKVKRTLEETYGITSQILVTFPDSEWEATSDDFKQSITNAGPLRLTQCPDFYRQLDAVVFPTLLECFSATPIEAQEVDVPLFASNISVIRETVGDYATYFDPLDPADIAAKIAESVRANKLPRANRARPGRSGEHYTATDRAMELLRLCVEGSTESSGSQSKSRSRRT